MSEEELLGEIKRHIDYTNTMGEKSLRDLQIENLYNLLQQKENIIKEIKEEVKIYEEQSNDGATNELDNYVFLQRLKNVLDKEAN